MNHFPCVCVHVAWGCACTCVCTCTCMCTQLWARWCPTYSGRWRFCLYLIWLWASVYTWAFAFKRADFIVLSVVHLPGSDVANHSPLSQGCDQFLASFFGLIWDLPPWTYMMANIWVAKVLNDSLEDDPWPQPASATSKPDMCFQLPDLTCQPITNSRSDQSSYQVALKWNMVLSFLHFYLFPRENASRALL